MSCFLVLVFPTIAPVSCLCYAPMMVDMGQIERVGRRIGNQFRADRVILFGSHATGQADADSDVDLMVVLAHQGRAVDKSVEIRLAVRPSFPVDLLVRTPEQVRNRLDLGDPFMEDIVRKGKVLYEAADG